MIANNDFLEFQKEIGNAIGQYGEAHIDIVYAEDRIYGMYHSGKNSFGVTADYSSEMASREEIENLCNALNIGYCEG